MSDEYLRKILTARVYDVVRESELERARALSAHLRNNVYLKREDAQSVFSFKLRGAYNKMAQLTPAARARGVVTASAGNHAQGVAVSAARLGTKAVIVVPTTAPDVKLRSIHEHGGAFVEVVRAGYSYAGAYAHAQELREERDLTFIPAFDDPDVIAGQGTIAMEILRQAPGSIHAIFVPIGGGGLAAGVATYVKAIRPEIKVIGVQTNDSCAMARSLKEGRRIALDEVGLFSDGTAVSLVGEETFRLCQLHLDDVLTVTTDALCAAIKDVFQDTRSVVEPAGALAIAGLKRYVEDTGIAEQTLVAIASGANMNFDRLRFVADRTEVGEAREALFGVAIPEERGSFRRLCEVVGARSVTEFNYRLADANTAHILLGVRLADASDADVIERELKACGFGTVNLTSDDLAKQHVRHMVGGRAPSVNDECLYRFQFPERPGALLKFLLGMSPSWNVSLFHYRYQGADYGSVLVGMQVPRSENDALERFLSTVGYPYTDESASAAYRLFLT